MSRGINKVILIANLGQDPETRMTQGGSAVTNFSVATDESYKDKQTGQLVPKTEWHNISCFNRLAEIARDYLKKGSKVYIEGRLQTRKWQDKTGQDRYTTEVIANELQMLDSRQSDGNAQQQYQQAPQNRTQASPMANNPQDYAQQQAANYQAPMDDFDSDVPF